ncbi:MAG: MFS transporter [Bacillota bacterium]
MAVSFLSILGYGAQRAILPAHLKEMGAGVGHIGFLLSLYGVPRALMNVAGGYLADRFSRKWNLVAGVMLYLASYMALAVFSGSVSVSLSRISMGIGLSWGTTAAMAVLSDNTSERSRGTVFGLQKAFFWAGITLSGYFAGRLGSRVGFSGVMLGSAYLGALGVLLVALLLTESRHAEERRRPPTLSEASRLLEPRFLMLGFVGTVSKVLDDGVIVLLLPLFLVESGMGNAALGALLVTCYTASFAVGQPVGGALSDSAGRLRIVWAGHWLSACGLALGLLSRSAAGLMCTAVLLGLGTGFVSPTAEALSGEAAPSGLSGTSLGLWRLFRDTGSFVGPAVLGAVSAASGIKTALVTAGAMVAVAQVFTRQLKRAGFEPSGCRTGQSPGEVGASHGMSP